MKLLSTRGLEQLATQNPDGRVDTSKPEFLDPFIDHDPIEHLRKGGTGKDGVTVKGSSDALNAIKEEADEQAMFHATDRENLHASTGDSVTVRDVVAGWLIDHDVETKGHRNALLNTGITEIGVGTSTAAIVDKTGQEVAVKITGMNFYGVGDFSTEKLIEKPPTR